MVPNLNNFVVVVEHNVANGSHFTFIVGQNEYYISQTILVSKILMKKKQTRFETSSE